MHAASKVEDIALIRQLRQQRLVNNAGGFGGIRQQVDQHASALQEFAQLGLAGEALHLRPGFAATAPDAKREPPGLQTFRNLRPQHAGAHNPDGEFVGAVLGQRLPAGSQLQRLIVIKAAEPVEHLANGILLHLPSHTGIFETKQRNRQRQHIRMVAQLAENRVHPCPEGEHGLQRPALQHLYRRMPDQGIVRRPVIARFPLAHPRAG